MVDLPDWTPQTATAEMPENRVTEGAVVRNADAIPEGLDAVAEGLNKLAVPVAQQEGVEAAQKVAITRAPDGSLNVATPQNSFIMGEAGNAYADAVAAGTLAKYHAQIDSDMVDMAQANKGNPANFQAQAGAYLQKLQSSDDPIAQHAAQYGALVAVQHRDGIVDRLGQIDTKGSWEAQQGRLGLLENDMDSLASQGGIHTPQFQQDATERKQILDGFVANPLFGYNAQQRQVDEDKFQTRLTESATVATARNLYQQTGNIGAAMSVLHGQIDKLPIGEDEKLSLEGKVMEHMRGLNAVSSQQNEDLKTTAKTAVTQAMADGRYDPQVFSNLTNQLTQRRLFADAANVGTAALLLQFRPAMQGGTAQDARTAYENFQAAIDKRQATFAPSAAVPLSDAERDLVIRTVAGEAGGEPDTGQAGVAAVIRNRVLSGQYGPNVNSVVRAPNQFSMWNAGNPAGDIGRNLVPGSPQYEQIGRTVDAVFSGKMRDPTNGADHYYNPGEANPDWAPGLAAVNDVTIGHHRFVGGPGTPNPAEVQPVVSAYVKQAQAIYNDRTKQLWGPMKTAFDKGFMPSAQEFSDLKTLAPDVTDKGLLQDIQEGLGTAQQMEIFKKLPLAQQQDAVASMSTLERNGGLDNIQRTLAGHMKDYSDYVTHLATHDPVSYASLKLPPNVADGLGNLNYNVGDPNALAQGLKAGQAYKNAARALDPSITNQGVMTDVKRDQLAAAMPSMSAQQVQGTLAALGTLRPEELDAEMQVDSTKNAVIGLTRSGDPGKMNAAYAFMRGLQSRNPLQFDAQFPGMSRDMAVWDWKSSYEPPDQVAKDMLARNDPAAQRGRALLDKQADTYLNGKDGAGGVDFKTIAGKFPRDWWQSAPDMMTDASGRAKSAMLSDYKDLFKDIYGELGDTGQADKYAMGELAKKYGTSGVNNGLLMAYPPERYYPHVNGSYDWIGKQLDGVIRQYTGAHPDADVSQRALVSDGVTQQEIRNGRPPSYYVVAKAQNGLPRPLLGPTGGVLRVRFDVKAAQGDAETKAEQDQRDALALSQVKE